MPRAIVGFGLVTMLIGLPGLSGLAWAGDTPVPKAAKKADAPAATVAVFRIRSVQESPADDPFSLGSGGKPTGLRELVARLNKAAKDDKVKAVVLLPEDAEMGPAQVGELRHALARLKAAGKATFAHADSLSMREYLLACGVGRLSLAPTGDVEVAGLYGESPYLRGLLDKLDVRPDFLTCGAYKSAAEVFTRTGPSPEAEKMQNWLLDSLFETAVGQIAEGRGVDAAKARAWVDGGPYTAEKARAAGLVDAVEHRQDLEKLLRDKYGAGVVFDKSYGEKKAAKVDLSSPLGLMKMLLGGDAKKPASKKPAVAVVHVEGAISMDGGAGSLMSEGGASGRELRRVLDEAARDDSVKAVVLRVNSPGGSAVASEIILDATRRVKAKKPFVVSMGDVAGSGGYYVACAADTVFADPATITGSIGVVSGKVATGGLFDKVGVTFREYRRGANAGMMNTNEVFTPAERDKMQGMMDEVYGVFKGHVAAARGAKLKKPIDELAGGRVYTGRQALELGLVDRLGTLDDAVRHVAGEAKLAEYEVRTLPEPRGFLERLLGDDDREPGPGLDAAMGQGVRLAGRGQPTFLEMALPHLGQLEGERLAAVRQALARLELMRREGVVLMMPEILIRR